MGLEVGFTLRGDGNGFKNRQRSLGCRLGLSKGFAFTARSWLASFDLTGMQLSLVCAASCDTDELHVQRAAQERSWDQGQAPELGILLLTWSLCLGKA